MTSEYVSSGSQVLAMIIGFVNGYVIKVLTLAMSFTQVRNVNAVFLAALQVENKCTVVKRLPLLHRLDLNVALLVYHLFTNHVQSISALMLFK